MGRTLLIYCGDRWPAALSPKEDGSRGGAKLRVLLQSCSPPPFPDIGAPPPSHLRNQGAFSLSGNRNDKTY